MTSNSFFDIKTKKSILKLKYLAYTFIAIVVLIGFIVSLIFGLNIGKAHPDFKFQSYSWIAIFYVVSFMIIWGILDVIKLLNNLYKGNIFTYENADLIKIIDKKIIFTTMFSIIVNLIMLFINGNPFWFFLIWIIFITFLVVGHIIVNPLALIVEKSADMHLEMELTI